MSWFKYEKSEPVRERIVRCCREALKDGPIGETERADFYGELINCGLNPAGIVGKMPVKSIASWKTSCALFVRAILAACGRRTTIAVNGAGMFSHMGGLHYQHPAWTRFDGTNKPKPGDAFYIASSAGSNDGHTGIFLEEIAPGEWLSAEGGGGAGTRCSFGKRTISNVVKFDRFNRKLLGWFDCEKLGVPFEEPSAEPHFPEPESANTVETEPEKPSNVIAIKPPVEDKPKDTPRTVSAIMACVMVLLALAVAVIERAC
jgi:hypothetical protein